VEPGGGFRELVAQGLAQPADELDAALGGAPGFDKQAGEGRLVLGGALDGLGRATLHAIVLHHSVIAGIGR